MTDLTIKQFIDAHPLLPGFEGVSEATVFLSGTGLQKGSMAETFAALLPRIQAGGQIQVRFRDYDRLMRDYAAGILTLEEVAPYLLTAETEAVDVCEAEQRISAAGFHAVRCTAAPDMAYDTLLFARRPLAQSNDREFSAYAAPESHPRLIVNSDFTSHLSRGIIGLDVLTVLDRHGLRAVGRQEAGVSHVPTIPPGLSPLVAFDWPAESKDIPFFIGHVGQDEIDTLPRNAWLYLFHEHYRLPQAWIERLSRFARVFFVSPFCAEAAVASGLRRPYSVMLHGYDPTLFYPEVREPNAEFTFLSVGRQSLRKGVDVLIKTFDQRFKGTNEKVRLIVKDVDGSALRYMAGKTDKITLIHEAMTREQVAALIRRADCLVLPSRAEGFALPVLEAKASGVPVITTGYGGQMAYCSEEDTYLIRHRMVRQTAEWMTGAENMWAEPDEAHLLSLYDQILSDPAERAEKAKRSLQRVKTMTWDQTTDPLMRALGEA